MQSYVRAISEGKNGSHISGISTVALADALIDSWFFGGSKEETLIQNPEANSEILEPLGITMFFEASEAISTISVELFRLPEAWGRP